MRKQEKQPASNILCAIRMDTFSLSRMETESELIKAFGCLYEKLCGHLRYESASGRKKPNAGTVTASLSGTITEDIKTLEAAFRKACETLSENCIIRNAVMQVACTDGTETCMRWTGGTVITENNARQTAYAKAVNEENGKTVYGMPIKTKSCICIIPEGRNHSYNNRTGVLSVNTVPVKPETVAFSTGLNDSEKNPIWESDRLKICQKGSAGNEPVMEGTVRYVDGAYCLVASGNEFFAPTLSYLMRQDYIIKRTKK